MAKLELIAGRTDMEDGTAQMLDKRYTAASKLPVNRRALRVDAVRAMIHHGAECITYPVRNKFPMLAAEKSNLLVGRMRLTISWLMELRKLRINSLRGTEMSFQIGCVASRMSSHSSRAGP